MILSMEMMLRGEVKRTENGLSDFLLLPCQATRSSQLYVNYIAIMGVLRGDKRFLIVTSSADWSCGRVSAQ
jgi:hypothetical protein